MFNLILEYEPKAIRIIDSIQEQIQGRSELFFVYCTPRQKQELELIVIAPNIHLVSPQLSGNKNHVKQYLLTLSKNTVAKRHTVLLKPNDSIRTGFIDSIRQNLKGRADAFDVFIGSKKETRIVNHNCPKITYKHGYLTGYKNKVTLKNVTIG